MVLIRSRSSTPIICFDHLLDKGPFPECGTVRGQVERLIVTHFGATNAKHRLPLQLRPEQLAYLVDLDRLRPLDALPAIASERNQHGASNASKSAALAISPISPVSLGSFCSARRKSSAVRLST
jgi:hypothetical protein